MLWSRGVNGTFSLLAVPAWEPGRGGGHLSRCRDLVCSVRERGGNAWLYLPPEARAVTETAGIGELLINEEDEEEAKLRTGNFSLIVLDRYKTEPGELKFWCSLGPVAGIDEGGFRSGFDFLLDLLPGLPGREPPNISDPSLIPLPERRRPSFHSPLNRVLVSFGAEDRAGLTVPAALALCGRPPSCEVTAAFGPLASLNHKDRELLESREVTVLETPVLAPAEFRNGLADYDLLITHFGLGAFEGLYARVPVLLVSPGRYHEALARHAGFVSAGTGKRAAGRLFPFLSADGKPDLQKYRSLAEVSEKAALRWGLKSAGSLAELFLSWKPSVHRGCPLCASPGKTQKEPGRLLARFPGRTYRRCSCGLVYLDRSAPPPQEYDSAYFFEDYKKQYGKTYLEDFPQLKKNGERRLTRIKALLPAGEVPRKLLDIGCAYGPFLAAARDGGFDPRGIDPSEDAAAYVRQTLNIPAVRDFFPPAEALRPASFDVVTLWFVIEHFKEPRKVLVEINRILKPGGILAFSTPSYNGVSRRKSPVSFLNNSPADHWIIWDPRRCTRMLARFGFRVKKREITGHHPERFPVVGPLLKTGGGGYRFFNLISLVFGLGDTFCVYAVKTGEFHG
jgi:2-polyprenyl-3-methyl-5-hydroxy-6-metoxy-1,4-benzoquinol methylase